MKSRKRKADDQTIMALNSVGLSLSSIAKIVDCHHTNVTMRLKENGIPPVDTRRSFMEDIFKSLTYQQQNWLMNQLGPTRPVKDFVRGLIIEAFIKGTSK